MIGGPAPVTSSAEQRIVDIRVVAAEKRRDGGKHYVYELNIFFEGVDEVRRVWRRYSQFDALRDTSKQIASPAQRCGDGFHVFARRVTVYRRYSRLRSTGCPTLFPVRCSVVDS